ncbi:MAG: tRNA 2-thiouridine(34) synthase MnmA [Anaerolineae bacterium]|nr:tRNA 2-thiouridine(34) synthase MnmA [Anaerolineae bacterium]
MTQQKGKVVVAMSGGVDSSVAAALLVEQGYQVTGMMLRLWSEPGMETYNRCCTPAAMANARQVASILDIPFYAIDAKDRFREVVVEYFLDGYAQGVTPNPCLACNRHIRWEYLLNRALALGADYMATGHYARVEHAQDRPVKLYKAVDPEKDQSYVLSVLNQEQLRHALFPLGGYSKPQIRALAEKFNLPVAQTKDSQDLCFLAGTDYRSFLERHGRQQDTPGPIKDLEGVFLGEHSGLSNYTIGQRKGLGIAMPEPYYVIRKDISTHTLVVGKKHQLGSSHLSAANVNWLDGKTPRDAFDADIKIRYTAKLAPGRVIPDGNDGFSVEFMQPQRDITPGQAAVIYKQDLVIGSGIIQGEAASNDNFHPVKLLEVTS